MSGGHFDYVQDKFCEELFGWSTSPCYGIGQKSNAGYKKGVAQARKANPLEDKLLSELVFDVACLIHSYDWYASGDNDEVTWRDDATAFKRKWFKKGLPEDLVKGIVSESCEELRKSLMDSLSFQPESKSGCGAGD